MSRMARGLQLLFQRRTASEIDTDLGMRSEAVESMIDHLVQEGYIPSIQCRFCAGGCLGETEQRMFTLTPKRVA